MCSFRMVKAIKSDPSKYGVDDDKLFQTDKMLYTIKSQLLDGRIFQNCIEQEFDHPGLIDVSNNKELRKEFFVTVKTLFAHTVTKIGNKYLHNSCWY